ncbi:tripartite tricarboxylate transporter substrate binding protein [Ramlibacter sp. AN1015]|uniref:Bug family tripartite tricarboxylate transporter substrate binding protein n=1 Tax=Ramlibacter sp. AN1015 TaxID=3133428 RepID=UPI0030BA473D
MHPNLRRRVLAACAAACAASLLPALPALAQSPATWPTRPVTLVVPYPAGGVADQFARSLADALSKRIGQPVVIDNRAGANGNLGSAFVARQSAPDGHTLLLGSVSNLAINPHLYASMGYEPLKDLQPVTLTHQMPNVLLTNPQAPFKSVGELVTAAKAKPNTIPFGSAGNGNTMHMTGVQFEKHAGIDLVHVPYKGGPPAMQDVLGGQIPMMFHNLPAVVSMHSAGKVRVLAVADTKRSPLLPQVPTFTELGLPGVVTIVWNGLLVRKGTPDAIVERMNQEIVAVLQSPEFRKPLEQQGYEVLSSSPQQFADLLKKDTGAMGELAKAAGLKME